MNGDVMKRIRDLLARATHASTPEEEARTCALIAARLIVANDVELRGKIEPAPPPPRPPPATSPQWWPFGDFRSPFGGSPFDGSSYAPPYVAEYDPMYEGMAWSRNPKPCPMCGTAWPRDGRLCPCTRPQDVDRAAKWARSWGYSVRPQAKQPPRSDPFPNPFNVPNPFDSEPASPAEPPPPPPAPKKRRAPRKRKTKEAV